MINIDSNIIFSGKTFVIYLVVINILTFFAMGIDKWKAKRGAWRISEGALLTMVLFGGGLGGIIGMFVFHHKTKKPKFYIGFPAIFIVEVATIIYILVTRT